MANEKCKAELIDHVRVPEDRFHVVADGDSLPLGGKTLTFAFTPWVHWPETMCTWLAEDRLLFTCDFFGSHLATSDVYADEASVYSGARRYYAEIMMPFAAQVAKDVEKVAQFPAEVICPSHGPLYDRPAFIMDLYREWASGAPRNVATLAYVSMHDSTRLMADHLTAALAQRGVAVERFELTSADVGDLAASLVDAATVLVGTPTVLTGPHPAAAYAAFLVNALKPKARHIGVFGSYGWAGKAPEKLAELLPNFKGELLDPVMAKGLPKAEDYAALDALADAVAERHRGPRAPMRPAAPLHVGRPGGAWGPRAEAVSRFFVNERGHTPPAARTADDEMPEGGDQLAFHRSMPGYRPTRLVSSPELARRLGIASLLIKDESSRFGLPAFKVLGASWAVNRALADRLGSPPAASFAELRAESGAAAAADAGGGNGRQPWPRRRAHGSPARVRREDLRPRRHGPAEDRRHHRRGRRARGRGRHLRRGGRAFRRRRRRAPSGGQRHVVARVSEHPAHGDRRVRDHPRGGRRSARGARPAASRSGARPGRRRRLRGGRRRPRPPLRRPRRRAW